ncbi:hypothetical protein LTR85_002110 [Meristemomyces frigidus]|nr:hypothetical protein LTR85_002110 [Meristemomyces frigidus]
MSGLVDFGIMGFPVFLVLQLEMRTWMKIRIVTSFGLRVVLVPLAVLRLVSLADSTPNLFDLIIPELYLQIEMCYNIISATIPCLGMFLQGASPDFIGGHNYIDPTASAIAVAGGSTYKMSNLSSNRRKNYEDGSIKPTTRKHGESMAQAFRGGGEDVHSVASDSSERAIVVQRTVDVQYDGQ